VDWLPPLLKIVQPPGIEPGPTDFQSAVRTSYTRVAKVVAMDSFEMSAYRLSSDCSASELHGIGRG
jgi:hypothetical protein